MHCPNPGGGGSAVGRQVKPGSPHTFRIAFPAQARAYVPQGHEIVTNSGRAAPPRVTTSLALRGQPGGGWQQNVRALIGLIGLASPTSSCWLEPEARTRARRWSTSA